jgi:autotransporter-associated beta strand protein
LNTSTTFAGTMEANGADIIALTKVGTGTLTLSGPNAYTGNTTVSAGTLLVNGSTASGSAVTVQNTGTLGGSGTISGAVTVNSGGTLWAGTGAGSLGTLTLGASPTLNGQVRAEIYKGNSPSADKLVVSSLPLTYGGTLVVSNNPASPALASGDNFTLFNASSYNGWFSGVTLPVLASGLSWDTNDLATSGVLDVYSFTTTPLTVATVINTTVTIPDSKLANHTSSAKAGAVYPTGWTAAASTPSLGSASFDGSGNLVYVASGTPGTDTFTVTFHDGHGLQTMTVTVTVNPVNAGPTLSLNSGYQSNGGYGSFTASGIPNTTYDVEWAPALNGPWNPASNPTVTAAANGLISYLDTETISAYGGTVFYRLRQQ